MVEDRLNDTERQRLRADIGCLVTGLHTITGTGFGYPSHALGPLAATWRAAFGKMMDAVLADAETFGATLPRSPGDAAVAGHAQRSAGDLVGPRSSRSLRALGRQPVALGGPCCATPELSRGTDSRRGSGSGLDPRGRWNHWYGSLVDGVHDLGVVDPPQICRSDRKVRVTELALNDDDRDAFA